MFNKLEVISKIDSGRFEFQSKVGFLLINQPTKVGTQNLPCIFEIAFSVATKLLISAQPSIYYHLNT